MEIGLVDAEEPAFPGGKTEDDNGQKDERHPAGGGVGPPGEVRYDEHENGKNDADRSADQRRVNDVLLHERLHAVRMLVVIELGVVGSEHMDLRCRDPGALQLLFDDIEVVEVVAYEVMPEHFHGVFLVARRAPRVTCDASPVPRSRAAPRRTCPASGTCNPLRKRRSTPASQATAAAPGSRIRERAAPTPCA